MPPKRRRLGLIVLLVSVCAATIAVCVVALVFLDQMFLSWSGVTSNSLSMDERAKDPLSIEDVKEELKDIPRPLGEFCTAVRAKQLYFPDYLSDWRDGIYRRPDGVRRTVKGDAKSKGTTVVWAMGFAASDVVATLGFISWDGYSSGARGLMVTADWTMYLDHKDRIIGYSMHEYPKLP